MQQKKPNGAERMHQNSMGTGLAYRLGALGTGGGREGQQTERVEKASGQKIGLQKSRRVKNTCLSAFLPANVLNSCIYYNGIVILRHFTNIGEWIGLICGEE